MTWRVFHCLKRVPTGLQHAATRPVVLQRVTSRRRLVPATQMEHGTAMSDFEMKHLGAALYAAAIRVRDPKGEREAAISTGMDEYSVPDTDEFIVDQLTAALVAFGNSIRLAERDQVPLLGTEIK